jgi:ribonuclease-3
LYTEAFIHSSLNQFDTDTGQRINFERLEFLGDAILNAVVAAYFYKKVPHKDEGYLTQMRAKIVSRSYLNKLGKEFELIKFIKTTTRKSMFGDDIHGNILEALIGAVYLDKGFSACEKFIKNKILLKNAIFTELERKINSYKGLIINWCQKEKKNVEFEFFEDEEKTSSKQFSVQLKIEGEFVAKGIALSKKKAEEIASKKACQLFKLGVEGS